MIIIQRRRRKRRKKNGENITHEKIHATAEREEENKLWKFEYFMSTFQQTHITTQTYTHFCQDYVLSILFLPFFVFFFFQAQHILHESSFFFSLAFRYSVFFFFFFFFFAWFVLIYSLRGAIPTYSYMLTAHWLP